MICKGCGKVGEYIACSARRYLSYRSKAVTVYHIGNHTCPVNDSLRKKDVMSVEQIKSSPPRYSRRSSCTHFNSKSPAYLAAELPYFPWCWSSFTTATGSQSKRKSPAYLAAELPFFPWRCQHDTALGSRLILYRQRILNHLFLRRLSINRLSLYHQCPLLAYSPRGILACRQVSTSWSSGLQQCENVMGLGTTWVINTKLHPVIL